MVFSSLVFLLVFLPLVLGSYFLARKIRMKNAILCLFSLVFYAWGEPVYLFLMLGMILINYLSALKMENKEKGRKLQLILTLTLDIGAIGFFKYTDFLLNNIGSLLGISVSTIGVSLPIGISFFTFQIMSYVIDVYRRDVPAQKSLLNLATYICLFPQLVAGPIVRYQTVAAELEYRKESLASFSEGIHRFILGLSKKVILANGMAILADTVFDMNTVPTGIVIWLGALAYMFQIYYDFSGYSDMAIGLGKMFGFTFMENFNYPYIASSVTDFWRRWHISLSSWFRDYVYIPLGGNRRGKGRTLLNMLVVWLLTGLWHGASWNFVLWGLYYFVFLTIEKMMGRKRVEGIPAWIRHPMVLLVVLFGWILFRVENLARLGEVFRNMFVVTGNEGVFLLEHRDAVYPLYLFVPAIVACMPVTTLFGKHITEKKLPWIKTACDVVLFMLCIALLLGNTYNPFIYFRF